ncbi:sodium/hydrogen exchanger family protein [Listeria floridensis FSL S10-1187]|uniref:Sodium/hydrogen exchanger family protein n=1 Tax=Listeria floridensis FSL S10-1187 TaxID=1265817 RepID=A0ABN0RHQ6_9LIST|nr:sodium/hydrogen exchanger family protein [Listeria floridensis FSL S10-1187]
MARYQPIEDLKQSRKSRAELETELDTLSEFAIQVERDLIQRYFEKGKISRAEMKKCREDVMLMETDLLS